MKQNQKLVCRIVGLLAWMMAIQTGLSFYNPQTGRWLSRDPIGDRGFAKIALKLPESGANNHNLYYFVGNEPVAKIDLLGLDSSIWTPPSSVNAPPDITDITDQCANACADAKRRGMDKGDSAGRVCCGGKSHICIWNPPVTPLPTHPGSQTGKEIVLNCIKAHEAEHVRQGPSCGCGFYRPKSWTPKQDECEGYYTEMDCLRSGLSQCGGDPDCERVVNIQLAAAAANVLKNCGAAK